VNAACGPRPLGTLLYLPLLYGVGWLLVRPVGMVLPALRPDQLDLLGVLTAFALFLLTLPRRLRRAWGEPHPWQRLGLATDPGNGLRALWRGALKALLLLALVVGALLISGQARWSGVLTAAAMANAVALLGVGFAEELIFRGWLWGELELLIGAPRALVGQAVIFGLIHPWYRAPGAEAIGLLGGLILLGLALALQRRADGGSLGGAVGLHGGLVAGWFALLAGLIELSPATPAWLVGPGGASPNPIGGVLGWLGLGALLWVRRQWWRL
jgi:MYXO-CTERM domain-containing protein